MLSCFGSLESYFEFIKSSSVPFPKSTSGDHFIRMLLTCANLRTLLHRPESQLVTPFRRQGFASDRPCMKYKARGRAPYLKSATRG
jgi:hypothetical protein